MNIGVAKAVALIEEGFSERYVAGVLRVPRTNVRDAVRRFRETNALRNRFIPASEIRSQLKEVRNVTVSLRTVRIMLVERNLKSDRAPQLPQDRKERDRFARRLDNALME